MVTHLPNVISSIFGVTEPAIYGITLPMKKPFIISCIVGAIVGGYYGHFNFRKFFHVPPTTAPANNGLNSLILNTN